MPVDIDPPPPRPDSRADKFGPVAQMLARNTLPAEALDLFALLRHIDASSKGAKLGYSHTPREDGVRLGQNPSTLFAPSTIYSIGGTRRDQRPVVKILSFGVFGPNGALPLHLTEYIRERLHNNLDSSPADFIDIFHHRLISLFYRAWSDSQSVVQLDQPGIDKFSFYAGALVGMGFEGSWKRNTIEDSAKLYAAGHLLRLTRNPEGLENLLAHYFGTSAGITEFNRTWIRIDESEQTRLSGLGMNNQLGVNAVAGARVQDVQSKFRIALGAMPLSLYESFLPTFRNNRKIRDWVRDYIGIELDWDLQLLLAPEEVPPSKLGGSTRLGWTSWLGERKTRMPADDLRLNPEKDATRFAKPAPA
ncbi:type VI secretion system baseplate subunit TssG [Comamonas sp. 4034]|uniref:type VI secretion system baseplate subunit TssG n=1 Tax=Comamonas sp. 4034 TaxID=3156455 RepID=UPI003D1FD7AC